MTYSPPCDRPIPRSLLAGSRAIFLLTIRYARQTLRYSTRTATVTDSATGATWAYRGGLPPLQPRMALDVLSQDPEAPSVSLSLIVEEPIADWVSWGHRLETGSAELAWWVDGSDWSERQVLIEGPMLGGAYGGAGDPLSFTLEPQRRGTGVPLLDPRDVVSVDTAGSLGVEAEEGAVMPLVFGAPGLAETRTYRDGITTLKTTQLFPGSPAPRWREDADGVTEIFMCRGHVAAIGNVTVYHRGSPDAVDGSTEVDGSRIRLEYTQGDGVPITVLDVSHLALTKRKSTSWGLCWQDALGAVAEGRAIERSYSLTLDFTSGPGTFSLAPFAPGDRIKTRAVDVTTAFDGTTVGLEIYAQGYGPPDAELDPSAHPKTIGTYTATDVARRKHGGVLVAQLTDTGSTVGSMDITVSIESRRSLANVGPVDTLGKLVSYLVTRSDQRLDRAAWHGLAAELPQRVGGFVNDPANAWDYLKSVVLPLLPVSLRFTSQGISPVLWRWHAGTGRAVARLTDGVNGVVVLPDIRSARADGEVNTAGRMRYAWDPLDGLYRGEQWLRPRPEEQDEAWKSLTGDSGAGSVELAAQTYGEGRVLEMESRIIQARETADWVLRHRLAAEGAAHRKVQVETDQVHGYLMEGDVITVTASRYSLDGAVGLVSARSPSDVGRCLFDVLLIEGYESYSTGPTADKGGGDRPGDDTSQ